MSMTLTAWPKEQRPRERLIQHGPAALSDAELLAIFLRVGIPGKNVMDLSHGLLQRFGSEEDGVAMANDTDYGLAATVVTGSRERAERVAAQLRAGTVWVNCFFVRDLSAPFGGSGRSGADARGRCGDCLGFRPESGTGRGNRYRVRARRISPRSLRHGEAPALRDRCGHFRHG